MIISHVVALSNNNVIGVNNDLPWKLKSDLAHFKNYTNKKIIVMGRKTFDSIGRPLPNRINYVISRKKIEIKDVSVFNSVESAIKSAHNESQEINSNEIVIIGGGYIFKDTLNIVNKLVLTRVDCNIEGDVFYPAIDLSNWKLESSKKIKKSQEDEYDYKVEEYVKK